MNLASKSFFGQGSLEAQLLQHTPCEIRSQLGICTHGFTLQKPARCHLLKSKSYMGSLHACKRTGKPNGYRQCDQYHSYSEMYWEAPAPRRSQNGWGMSESKTSVCLEKSVLWKIRSRQIVSFHVSPERTSADMFRVRARTPNIYISGCLVTSRIQ